MAEKQNLMSFLTGLAPEKDVPIGEGKAVIKAMPLGVLTSVARQFKEFGLKVKQQGVTWENYKDKESLIIIAVTLLEDFPSLLSDITNIDQESLEAMPLEIVIELISASMEVNAEAKESFLKNFKSLAGNLQKLLGTEEMEEEEEETNTSQKISNKSSRKQSKN